MNTRRTIARIAIAALIASPVLGAKAQSGDGFLFKKPTGSITVRGGYTVENTSDTLFGVMRSQTTIGPRSFDQVHLGVDLGFAMTRRFDLGLSVDASTRRTNAEYRDWIDDQTQRPISHESRLDRIGVTANVRYNLVDRGRSISSLAFIPARYLPYIGAGGGFMQYDLTENGDFVEETGPTTANIFTDELSSTSWGAMAQAFTGLDYRVHARLSLIGEARYTRAFATLNGDYSDFERINLSGLALSFGTSFRF